MSSDHLPHPAPTTKRLLAIRDQVLRKQQLQRDENGMEVPMFVLPITPDEALSIIAELLARRRASNA